ncbi:MAG: hypothetical protein LUE92_07180 [Clostridiales bacterium]|nr:hypothetical protein [Clostridiales bacterium]
MINIKEVADKADMIIAGYAFTKCEIGVRVLNLNKPEKAAVLSDEGEMLETSMDDIELRIIKMHYAKNKQFMGE